ncbi:hypothetical protein K438DRAFT_1757863 [Mycena galopus ATCC 62051]|nr:hypothetical protein K438DRAFT_1757863 [Mycena galopus ATCC 62051]
MTETEVQHMHVQVLLLSCLSSRNAIVRRIARRLARRKRAKDEANQRIWWDVNARTPYPRPAPPCSTACAARPSPSKAGVVRNHKRLASTPNTSIPSLGTGASKWCYALSRRRFRRTHITNSSPRIPVPCRRTNTTKSRPGFMNKSGRDDEGALTSIANTESRELLATADGCRLSFASRTTQDTMNAGEKTTSDPALQTPSFFNAISSDRKGPQSRGRACMRVTIQDPRTSARPAPGHGVHIFLVPRRPGLFQICNDFIGGNAIYGGDKTRLCITVPTDLHSIWLFTGFSIGRFVRYSRGLLLPVRGRKVYSCISS